jgi:2-iminobutanoate/2-iminopropanoate deaminase
MLRTPDFRIPLFFECTVTITKQVISIPSAPKAGPYSHAVRAGELLFLSGQAGIDPSTGQAAGPTFRQQARQAFANLRTVLEEAGSGLPFVIKTTCFLTNPDDFPELNALYAEHFPEAPPARSAPVVVLPRKLLFSIEAVAVIAP